MNRLRLDFVSRVLRQAARRGVCEGMEAGDGE